jgi:hypothetical protein
MSYVDLPFSISENPLEIEDQPFVEGVEEPTIELRPDRMLFAPPSKSVSSDPQVICPST